MLVSRRFGFAVLICAPTITAAVAIFPATSSIGSTQENRLQLAQGGERSAAGGAKEKTGADIDAAASTAGSAAEEAAAAEEDVIFTEEFLADPAHQDAGKVVWEVCAGCHGARAYPGKAPQLRPKKYTPEFVFDRVTNGYRKMPPWKDVFTKEERMDVVAYILSPRFAP